MSLENRVAGKVECKVEVGISFNHNNTISRRQALHHLLGKLAASKRGTNYNHVLGVDSGPVTEVMKSSFDIMAPGLGELAFEVKIKKADGIEFPDPSTLNL